MKSKILKDYIDEGGSNSEECCFTIFIEKHLLKDNTNYEDVISIVMPKFIEKINKNYDFYFDKKTKNEFKLIDSDAQLYSIDNDSIMFLEPFEEGFLNNTSKVKDYLNYLYKIEHNDYDSITINEDKYEDFPWIEDLCEFEISGCAVYEDGEITLKDNYWSVEELLELDIDFICLNVILFMKYD